MLLWLPLQWPEYGYYKEDTYKIAGYFQREFIFSILFSAC